MVLIKAYNVNHQNRPNQNTSWWIHERDYGLNKDQISESALMRNFDQICPPDVVKQKNTKLKIQII